jgi:hypothetical protein
MQDVVENKKYRACATSWSRLGCAFALLLILASEACSKGGGGGGTAAAPASHPSHSPSPTSYAANPAESFQGGDVDAHRSSSFDVLKTRAGGSVFRATGASSHYKVAAGVSFGH